MLWRKDRQISSASSNKLLPHSLIPLKSIEAQVILKLVTLLPDCLMVDITT
ncbi:MAG: hypothetical protein ACT6FB_01320 [Methanosarcinaceae archaeon]